MRFRALIENSSDGIALLADDATVLYASPPTAWILGYEAEEMIGKHALAHIHVDDLPRTRELCRHLRQTTDTHLSCQLRYQHKDGSWRWLESNFNNLLAEPGVAAIVVNFRDVTERKQAEEEREQFLNRANVARAAAETAAERLRAIQ